MSDPISHPAHYTSHPSGIEVIQITEHMNFCLGNVVKYVLRADLKHDDGGIEDLSKAAWYLARELERRQSPANTPARTSTPDTEQRPAKPGLLDAQHGLRVGARVKHRTGHAGTVANVSKNFDGYWGIEWDEESADLFKFVHERFLEVIQ